MANQFGQVGPQQVASGTNTIVRQGNAGETIVTELNSRLYEQGIRGNRFYAVNSAAQALSLTSTTTYTGLALANPTGSGKNLIIDRVGWATTIAPTGVGAVVLGTSATVALTTGSSSGPGGTTVVLGSGNASVAKVGASCTLGANPTFIRPILGVVESTAAGYLALNAELDVAGDIIVPPGQQIEIAAVTTAITGVAYISWTEVSSTVL